MSRTSLHRPRRNRAVSHRPATDTRLLPSPFPPTILHINTHYKRCPKALRLRLRSDQSPSRPLHGRSPDKSRHALSKGHCQVRASLTRRILLASSGDAPEHGVMSLPRAIAPPPDSPGLDLAGESEQSDNLRLKTNAPFRDSTVVTIGELRSTNAGHGSTLPSLRVVEHFWWSRPPHTENFSGLVHIPSEVRGKDSTVVTTGELPTTNAGHGSPLPSLGMVEHFWWSRLPHSETPSRLLHILSEVRGCRRVVADAFHIGTGVDAFSRNRPGPSITSPFSLPFRGSARNLGLARSPISALSTPSPRGACPPEADHSQLTSGCKRTVRLGTVHLWRSVKPSPGAGYSARPERSRRVSRAEGVAHDCQFVTPLPHHPRKDPPTTPYPHNLPCPIQRKRGFPAKQSKFTPESAHQSKLPLPTSNKGAARPLNPIILDRHKR